jgi:hypothetical protein
MELSELQKDLSYEEYPVRILDIKDRETRRKNIRFVKVQWSNHSEEGEVSGFWFGPEHARPVVNCGPSGLA